MKMRDGLLSVNHHTHTRTHAAHRELFHTITSSVSVDACTSGALMCNQPEGRTTAYIKPAGLVWIKILIWTLARYCDRMRLLGLAKTTGGIFLFPFFLFFFKSPFARPF